MKQLLIILFGAVMSGPLIVGACGSSKADRNHDQEYEEKDKQEKDKKPEHSKEEDADLDQLRSDIGRLLGEVSRLNETISKQQGIITQLNQTIIKQQEVINRFLEEAQPAGDVVTKQGTCSITANSVSCVWGQ